MLKIIAASLLIGIGMCLEYIIDDYTHTQQQKVISSINQKLKQDNVKLFKLFRAQEEQRDILIYSRKWTPAQADEFVAHGCLNYIEVIDENISYRY